MPDADNGRRHQFGTGFWRLELYGRVERLELTLRAVADGLAKTEARQHLAAAKTLAAGRQTLAEAWTGMRAERAWTELRLAEEAYYAAIADPDKLIAVAGAVLAEARAKLSPTDPRARALADALKARTDSGRLGALREQVVAVGIAAHSASDLEHRVQRQFRSLLRSITLGLALLAGLVVGTVLVVPVPAGWLPVPAGLPAGSGIALAMVVGAFGALLSAVPSLSQAPANPTTYSPSLVQALLKIVVGAWSALVGLVAVSAGVQAAPTGGSSVAGFVLMCAVFGASQEALTRFADHKAAATKPTTT